MVRVNSAIMTFICLHFRPILSKVKAKSMIQLPNWVATISPVIEETPVSQMSQTQAPEPRIPGMPSPHKIHGSFLNKPVSPRPNRSPVRAPPSPVLEKKKKLDLEGFSDGVSFYEYVKKQNLCLALKGRPWLRGWVFCLESLAPHYCGFISLQGLWILSCEEAVQLA